MNFGCSSFTWETEDGQHLLGRTYDRFGNLKSNRVIGVPKGVPCAAGMEAGSSRAAGRYTYTGMAVLGFGEPVLVDGVNSAGLMGALLHYPEYAVYQERAEEGKTAVHPGRLLAWLLSRCADTKEAEKAMSAITLVDEPIQGKPLSAHYILGDRRGKTLIMEPDAGGLHIYR